MPRKKSSPKPNRAEARAVRSIDELAEYEKFRNSIAPKLRQAVLENWSAEKIYQTFAPVVAAKAVTMAVQEEDPVKALAAIKEVLDRGTCKAKERIEATHKYQKLDDEARDNLLENMLEQEGLGEEKRSRKH
jgi:hypothetical protein